MESRYFSLEKQASDKAFEDSKSPNTRAAQAVKDEVLRSKRVNIFSSKCASWIKFP